MQPACVTKSSIDLLVFFSALKAGRCKLVVEIIRTLRGVDGMGEFDLIAMRATSKYCSFSHVNCKSSEAPRPMPALVKLKMCGATCKETHDWRQTAKKPVDWPHTQNDLLEKDLPFASLKEERKPEVAEKRATGVQP